MRVFAFQHHDKAPPRKGSGAFLRLPDRKTMDTKQKQANAEQKKEKTPLPQAFYSTQEVCQVTGLARMTIHRMIEAGKFVPKLQLSPGRVAFRVADVSAWIDSRAQVAA